MQFYYFGVVYFKRNLGEDLHSTSYKYKREFLFQFNIAFDPTFMSLVKYTYCHV
jgi:hypothetical protein